MAWRSFKKDLDKTYQKIDKIVKKGKDNFQEYSLVVTFNRAGFMNFPFVN